MSSTEALLKLLKKGTARETLMAKLSQLTDYFAVAALRRQIALANPLLSFDRILFVGRGNYYGDHPTGQHQISGPLAFCNRVGGGLYMVKSFRTEAVVAEVSAGILTPFVCDAVEPGSTVHTDGWNGYNKLPKRGYNREKTVLSATGDPAYVVMPAVHRVASLLKR